MALMAWPGSAVRPLAIASIEPLRPAVRSRRTTVTPCRGTGTDRLRLAHRLLANPRPVVIADNGWLVVIDEPAVDR